MDESIIKAQKAEEKRAKIRESQKKYYERKKAEGLLNKLKENYDPEERKKRYAIEKEEKNILEKQRQYNLRKKQEEEKIMLEHFIKTASEDKIKLIEQLTSSGIFDKLTLSQKKEILKIE